MEEYFVQAEELLTVHRACLLLKRKVPRDVLTEVTREDLHNLEELVNKIMDREEFLYPEKNRKIMVTDIETRGIPGLDPKMTPKTTVGAYKGDKKKGNNSEKPKEDEGKAKGESGKDMEEYFVQAEELLTVHRACLLLKRKVPRDVLTEVTREDLHNLEELVNKIMDREEFLYPEKNRKIMVTDIETRGIPGLDPKMTPKTTVGAYKGDKKKGNNSEKPKEDEGKAKGESGKGEYQEKVCHHCKSPGHMRKDCKKYTEYLKNKHGKDYRPPKTRSEQKNEESTSFASTPAEKE
eukprot:Nk52_evm1s581 gene=Nk52_evmTU1s581